MFPAATESNTGRSFNGRTRGSGPRYRGSNPCLPASYPVLRLQLPLVAFPRLLHFSNCVLAEHALLALIQEAYLKGVPCES